MEFMSNILPVDISRWEVTEGSIGKDKIQVRAGGTLSCEITTEDLAYIPKAFQLRLKHNVLTTWKNPTFYANLNIMYEDNQHAYAAVPLTAYSQAIDHIITETVVMLESKKFSKFVYSITNTADHDLEITSQELRPSIDMDDNLYASIDSMLPQLVYAYNDGEVICPVAVETQVVQLPVSVSSDSNLLLHLSVTGVAKQGVLACTVKLDGVVVKSFPVSQLTMDGEFYFGVPSLVAFVKRGAHMVSAHLTGSAGQTTVPKEGALIVLDGKGILGGASASYPSADVFQEILKRNMWFGKLQQTVNIESQEPSRYDGATTISIWKKGFNSETQIDLVIGGNFIDFMDFSSPLVDPFDSDVYFADYTGLRSSTGNTYMSTKELKEGFVRPEGTEVTEGTEGTKQEYTLVTLEVDTTKYYPVYSCELLEVK